MKRNHKTLFVIFSFAIIWIVLSMFTKKGVIYLADKYKVNNFDYWIINEHFDSQYPLDYYKNKYKRYGYKASNYAIPQGDLVFGFKFNAYDNNKKIHWMNAKECSTFERKIEDSTFKNINDLDYKKKHYSGFLYVTPKWVDNLLLRTLLFPSFTALSVDYWPEENYMYITQIPSEISADENIAGIHITNVPPWLIHLPINTIE